MRRAQLIQGNSSGQAHMSRTSPWDVQLDQSRTTVAPCADGAILVHGAFPAFATEGLNAAIHAVVCNAPHVGEALWIATGDQLGRAKLTSSTARGMAVATGVHITKAPAAFTATATAEAHSSPALPVLSLKRSPSSTQATSTTDST